MAELMGMSERGRKQRTGHHRQYKGIRGWMGGCHRDVPNVAKGSRKRRLDLKAGHHYLH